MINSVSDKKSNTAEKKSILLEVQNTERAMSAVRGLLEEELSSSALDKEPILVVRDICLSLLKGSNIFTNLGLSPRQGRGVIAEVMLEYVINGWLEANNLSGNLVSNIMIPKNPDKPEEGTTQLDTVVLTNKVMLVCECKSYAGSKTTDGIVLKSKNVQSKPWSQNAKHIMALKKYIKSKIKVSLPEIYNVVYVFAEGEFTRWTQPEPDNDIFLVNYGAFTSLNLLETSSDRSITDEERHSIVDLLRETIPDVEEQYEHIARLKKLI